MENRKTAVKWLYDQMDVSYAPDKVKQWFEKAKEMEKQELEKFYNHGQWAIIDHGHGDTFEDYYSKVYGKQGTEQVD